MKALLAILVLCSGCAHLPPGGAKEVRVKFGVPGVFTVEKNTTNIDVTAAKIRVGDTETKIGVALFVWESSAKGIILPNRKTEP